MVALTESAQNIVREMVQDEGGSEGSGVRIAAERGADGAAQLMLAVVPGPADGDSIVEEGGSRVFLEPMAAQMLDDKVIDAKRHDDHVHFSLAPQG
jgi:iron-sulfur cluster assembly protein